VLRPAEVVAVHRLEQLVDLLLGEAAAVVAVVDVPRARADEHEPVEQLRPLRRGERTDHRAHRVADEDDRRQVERLDDLDDVLRVALEPSVADGVVRRGVGAARPTWSSSTTRWVASNDGATSRHICWSQPKPCAKTIGAPSARPRR
jgi:hypothetical protein